jgi:pimeloyl-ACP methyl ester carboxylesterase
MSGAAQWRSHTAVWEVERVLGANVAMMWPRRGTFPTGMTYARLGDGPTTLLWLAAATRGPMLAMMARAVRPFVAAGYTVWLVSVRPNMPTGHTLEDMADDYARLIDEEFGGHVDLVIGHSNGGMIGFCLAARHPDRFGHIVIAEAGLWSERLDRANLDSARLLVTGHTRQGGALMIRFIAPNLRLPGVVPVLGALIGRATLAEYGDDLLVVAEAIHAFDPQEILPNIAVPVLLVGGENDVLFAQEELERAAQLIPQGTLRHYPGTNHFGTITSPRFAADTHDFIRQRQQTTA